MLLPSPLPTTTISSRLKVFAVTSRLLSLGNGTLPFSCHYMTGVHHGFGNRVLCPGPTSSPTPKSPHANGSSLKVMTTHQHQQQRWYVSPSFFFFSRLTTRVPSPSMPHFLVSKHTDSFHKPHLCLLYSQWHSIISHYDAVLCVVCIIRFFLSFPCFTNRCRSLGPSHTRPNVHSAPTCMPPHPHPHARAHTHTSTCMHTLTPMSAPARTPPHPYLHLSCICLCVTCPSNTHTPISHVSVSHTNIAGQDLARPRSDPEPLRRVPPLTGPRDALAPHAAPLRQRPRSRAVPRATREGLLGVLPRPRVSPVAPVGPQDAQEGRVWWRAELWREGWRRSGSDPSVTRDAHYGNK